MKISAVVYQQISNSKNIFIPLFLDYPLQKEEIFSFLPESVKKVALKFAAQEFKGENKEIKSLWLADGNPNRIVFFGLGEKSKWDQKKAIILPRRMVQYAKQEKISEFSCSLYQNPLYRTKSGTKQGEIFAANALMANFEFNQYKEKPKSGWPEVKKIFIAAEKKDLSSIQKGVDTGTIIGEETNHCRRLANTPGGDMTPQLLAEEAIIMGKKTGVSVRVLEEKDIKKLGMGGILGVSKGSDEHPKLIILEYKNAPASKKPLVLVGKGVTFDTGGLNLKPSNAINEMHMDMSGGAAVIHGIAAIARLKLPINVVGLIPAVENMPSGSSYRPGDLLKSMSGKTIEVLNTDAEGRIILADALFYATRYKPELMVDFATLTGSAHVSLGNYFSALFTQDENLQKKLIEVGLQSGDYVWPLPLWDEYLADIKGNFGDLANVGKERYGDAIHGAKFLEQFTEGVKWAHIDIAPRMVANESDCLAKGATGVGVRFIAELAKEYELLK